MGDMKGDAKEAVRKEVRRAMAPELATRIPAAGKKTVERYGIRYQYANICKGRDFVKWYDKESGRDQAFASMARPMQLASGRTYSLYAILEKVDR